MRSHILGLCFCLLLATPAMALKPIVVDGGELFSQKTVDDANAAIRLIKQAYGKDVMVETYPTIPADLQADFQRKGKEAFYSDWVESRAKALGVNGVMILITRDPGRLQVVVDPGTKPQRLTREDQDEIRNIMVAAFRDRKFDEGLTAGIERVRARLEQTEPRKPPVPQ
jgi:uncharacterized membrane protein YgcG